MYGGKNRVATQAMSPTGRTARWYAVNQTAQARSPGSGENKQETHNATSLHTASVIPPSRGVLNRSTLGAIRQCR
jgi:hypothetical protein